jgi:hypothetical protein
MGFDHAFLLPHCMSETDPVMIMSKFELIPLVDEMEFGICV